MSFRSAPQLRVLIVDDSRTIRRTAESLLSKAGCLVSTAEDGYLCLAMAYDFQPDIIFIDVMMPRLDGFQTAALFRAVPAFRSTPIVMLTSKDGLYDKARARMAGASDFVTKPFSKDDLLKTLAKHFPA